MIEVTCNPDRLCQGFREFDSAGDVTMNFEEIFVHSDIDCDIDIFENRKILTPYNVKSSLIIQPTVMPKMEYLPYSKNRFSSELNSLSLNLINFHYFQKLWYHDSSVTIGFR